MKLFGMIQTVTGITRVANLDGRITQSTIDVVMTNCYSNFVECKVLDDRIGDHQALKCTLDFKVNKASKFQKVLIRDQSLNNLKALSYFLGTCSNYSITYNIIYLIRCKLCEKPYVGKSTRMLRVRFGEHRRAFYKIISGQKVDTDDDSNCVGLHLHIEHGRFRKKILTIVFQCVS